MVHPKVKAAGVVAAVLAVADAVVAVLVDQTPSPTVLLIAALVNAVSPVIAGYLKSA